jgi:cytoskeletal protein CcmA (bactofilin family)
MVRQPHQSAEQPEGDGPSVIGADLLIVGTLSTKRSVQLEGFLNGDIHAAQLSLGENAHVHGNIYAEDARVRGRVDGNILARSVQLMSTARVTGDIVHDSCLGIESGARFDGNCRCVEL